MIMSWTEGINALWTFLFWLLTLLISYRVGKLEGKKIAARMIGKNIRDLLTLALLSTLIACGSTKPALMTYLGDVVLVNDCEVCVSYGNVGESNNSKTLGCFAHYEGHRYQVGDRYPDPAKHTTGTPTECGPSTPLRETTENHSPKNK